MNARPPRRFEFEAEILEGRGGGAPVAFPHDARAALDTGGCVAVRATFDGHPYRGSLVPMGGGHVLGMTKALRAATGKDVGDRVRVVVEEDAEPRVVEVPDDLAVALDARPGARVAWDALSYTHRKEHVAAILEAKRAATRARRVGATVERLGSGADVAEPLVRCRGGPGTPPRARIGLPRRPGTLRGQPPGSGW